MGKQVTTLEMHVKKKHGWLIETKQKNNKPHLIIVHTAVQIHTVIAFYTTILSEIKVR